MAAQLKKGELVKQNQKAKKRNEKAPVVKPVLFLRVGGSNAVVSVIGNHVCQFLRTDVTVHIPSYDDNYPSFPALAIRLRCRTAS